MVAPLVIDARTGVRWEHSSGLLNAVGQAAMAHGVNAQRADGSTERVLRSDGIDNWRKRSDGQFIERLTVGRKDSDFGGSAGGFPRDFEHIYAEILEEKRRPLNYTKQFVMDTRVPLGAKTHTVRRRLGRGDAAIYRGGTTGIPMVAHSFVEEQFHVIYIVSGVETNWFELISDSFEGRNQFADDSRMAIRAIEERINDVAWNGDAASQVYGALTYPHLAKSVGVTNYVGSASSQDLLDDLNAAANFAIEASGGTFRPTRVMTSIRVRNFLMQKQNSVASDISVGQFFLNGQETLNAIEGVHEMRGIGPAGQDGIMFYDDSRESSAFVMIQPPTAMPAHAINSFQNQTVYVAAIGGTVMRDVGNNHLHLVPFGS